MGSGSSKIPDISSSVVRTLRVHAAGKKTDAEAMLEADGQVQKAYREWGGKQVAQSLGVSANVGSSQATSRIAYEKEFKDRYFDVETVQKVLTEPDDRNFDEEFDKILEQHLDSTSFPIKLYICEPLDAVKENFEKMGKTVHIAVKNRLVGLFGLVHAALQIGDKMVHFVDNHFVKMDQFKAGGALVLINISKSGRLPKTDEVLRTIAEVIVKWNKEAKYDQAKCNCQDFVEDLCEAVNKLNINSADRLDLKFSENPIMQEYLNNLVEHPDKSGFHINFKGKLVEFNTHTELDRWEENNNNDLNDNQKAFLKGFHRAFQLRHRAAVKNKDYEKMEKYEGDPYAGCVRGDATII